MASLTGSEAKRVMEALQIGCREAVSDCKRAFSNEQCGQVAPTTWLRSCITDDGQLAVCRWDTGLAIINDVDAEGGVVSIQHSGLRKVSKWFCDYERAQSEGDSEALEELRTCFREANGVNSEKLTVFGKLTETMDPGGLQRALGFSGHQWPSKQLLPLWLDLKPGLKWEDFISFRKGNVELSRPKSRGPVLRIGLEELASVRRDYKVLIRAAIDGVVEASLPRLVSSFKERLFRCIDEVCAQATPRTAADSANLKALAAKVARTDATIQALFAKLLTDPEFGGTFEREVSNLRAERELKALEARLVADAELKEREVKALELKLAEDSKLERDRVSAEIEFRKEHLALESKKQSELLEQLRRQADAAEDAVTISSHQLNAMQEHAEATERAGRRVAKELEKEGRKNRGEWSILDEWFGG
ncbi:MAG: hypothetical protein HRU74_03940 [Chthonomonadaceae bacterium]|nr:MAG: hypothetical protein HRU74_03940 [Chthonomonadaceae bacterium]